MRQLPPARLPRTTTLHCFKPTRALPGSTLSPTLSNEQALQCKLPLRLGGRGLRSQARLAPAAWAASWAQSLREVLARTGLESLANLDACELPLAAACRATVAELPASLRPAVGDDDADPLDWRHLAQEPRKKLQKVLSKRLDEKTFADLLRTLGAEDRARLRSCAGPLASAWQVAAPAAPSEPLDGGDYRTTARSLLGQDVASDSATCSNRARTGARAGSRCGEALGTKAHHAHRCSRAGGLKERSADLERALQRIHQECGHSAERQVHVPEWDRWRWQCASCETHGLSWNVPSGPCGTCGAALESTREEAVLDLEIRSATAPRTYVDVTVRHSVPGDGSRLLAIAAGQDGAVARDAEGDKRRRYPDGRTPWRVLPFAVETYGRFGPAALTHLRGLAKEQAQHLGEDDTGAVHNLLVQRWAARLSVALHRSNAQRLRSALRNDPAQRARVLAEELGG